MRPKPTYAWQPKGEVWGIPVWKKKVMNVLGFLSPKDSHLITYPLPDGEYMDSRMFIKFVDDFAGRIKGETALILDRAPWHTSEMTRSRIAEWEEKGLFIFYLPAYSPHLNLIETLWRKMKHEWLSIKDYRSKSKLEKKIKEIFGNYGTQYQIEFSMNIFKPEGLELNLS